MVEPAPDPAASLAELGLRLDPVYAPGLRERLARCFGSQGPLLEQAVVLAAAYPALLATLESCPALLGAERASEAAAPAERGADGADPGTEIRRNIRLLARAGRLRIALGELLPSSLGGLEPVRAMEEISRLAEQSITLALAEAEAYVRARHGTPLRPDGRPGRLVVLGMGKLGGRELNPGSDVDLICLYDTDDAPATSPTGETTAAAILWPKVVARMVASLEEPTVDGVGWRVDLRLRPDGSHGPIALSLPAAERYYESVGRLWERAALLRARPVAGDLELGQEALAAFEPFVWRRRVDPAIAAPLCALATRARAELSRDPSRDLKLGPGGIRDVELFAQILQLVWGGRDRSLRVRSTLDALERLRSAGLLSEREAEQATAAYLLLRRAEHAIQHGTGLQTHALPRSAAELERLARVLGFADAASLGAALERCRADVRALVTSLLPSDSPAPSRWSGAIAAAERQDWAAFDAELRRLGLGDPAEPTPSEICRALMELGRHPDAPLGARSLERYPTLGEGLLEALSDAADPAMAAHYLRRFQARVRHPAVTASQLAADPASVRRLVQVLGSSAFVGEILAGRPELGDLVLFGHEPPTTESARAEVKLALAEAALDSDDRVEAVTTTLRRAKQRVTTEVALADLGEMLSITQCGEILSALADALLDAAASEACSHEPCDALGSLAVLAMGSLGAHQVGYGSDLDVLFLYEPAGEPDEALVQATRVARLMMRMLTTPHSAGPGYELDAQLRPSGRQGLLVVSLAAFARYHGVALDDAGAGARSDATPRAPGSGQGAAVWERLALLRARPAAGDEALGAAAMRVVLEAAYGRPTPAAHAAAEVDRLRGRVLRELARERAGRYDVKFGRGALAELQLGVELLQLVHGHDERVRTPRTEQAIDALGVIGALEPEQTRTLAEAHELLRRLEQRMRVVHGDDSHLLQQGAPGLGPLARRMGLRGRPAREAAEQLVRSYRDTTERVHRCYTQIIERLTSHG